MASKIDLWLKKDSICLNRLTSGLDFPKDHLVLSSETTFL